MISVYDLCSRDILMEAVPCFFCPEAPGLYCALHLRGRWLKPRDCIALRTCEASVKPRENL